MCLLLLCSFDTVGWVAIATSSSLASVKARMACCSCTGLQRLSQLVLEKRLLTECCCCCFRCYYAAFPNEWLSSVVVERWTYDSVVGREFDLRPWCYRVITFGKLLTPMLLTTCHQAVIWFCWYVAICPWSRSISWCLAEGCGNRDQHCSLGPCSSGRTLHFLRIVC